MVYTCTGTEDTASQLVTLELNLKGRPGLGQLSEGEFQG